VQHAEGLVTVPADPPRIVATAPVPSGAVADLYDLAGRAINFEPMSFAEAATDPTWHTDHRLDQLPGEPPGEPIEGGPFLVARQALIDYEFADPRLIHAVYDAAVPFEGRNMLLVGRFLGLRFAMGVRVGGVVDRVDATPAGPAHRFAWYYRTLEGHLEEGQMDYEVTKLIDTGDVHFRIRAYSRRGRIENPMVRLGFTLFGRREQLRFYDRSVERLRRLVEERAHSFMA
jgi:uncharacterized protein (UPF0548 family)